MTPDPTAALEPAGREALRKVLELLAAERASVSSVVDERAWKVHVADSLTGLQVPELRSAERIADVGAGAGFPGLALAVALPAAQIDLIESVGRKCDFMTRAIESAKISNAAVLNTRSEEHAAGAGRESYDVVAARAVGRLSTLAELASPLLKPNGVLVAWKGKRDEEEERQLGRAGAELDDGARANPRRRRRSRQPAPPPPRRPQDRTDPGLTSQKARHSQEAPQGLTQNKAAGP